MRRLVSAPGAPTETREARAERLRPHVERWVREAGSLKAFAARAELLPDAIGRYLRRKVTPSNGTLDAFDDLLQTEEKAAEALGDT